MSDKPPAPPAPPPPDDDDDDDLAGAIRPVRFERMKAQRNAARTELAAARARIAELEGVVPKVAAAESAKSAAEAAKAAAEAKLAETMEAHEHYRAAASSGIADPEVFELFRWQYSRAFADDPKKRPPFGDWIKGLREKPGEAPATLRPHLGDGLDPKKGAPPPKGSTTPAPGSKTAPPPPTGAEERRKLAMTPEGREQIAREIRARRKAESGGGA